MAGMFIKKRFSEIDLNDSFFDSLKSDYPEFEQWFIKKSDEKREALIFEDDDGIGAFVALKEEIKEGIKTERGALPIADRIKICTLKISNRHSGERIGEGVVGLTLWKWQKSKFNEIYVTVFDKHQSLINLLCKFGFKKVEYNEKGEGIYIKNKQDLDFSNPYTSFPFIKNNFDYAGYVIIDDNYHDTMFAYSELAKTISLQEIGHNVTNGLTKIYVGKAPIINYKKNEPVLIYRRDTKNLYGRQYRSCVTSFCIVTDTIQAKTNNNYLMSFEDLKKRIGNKSVFDEKELCQKYETFKNVTIIELLYYGYFGAGNNVTMNWLKNNGCWSDQYPANTHLTKEQFKKILNEGEINVSDVIID